MHTSRRGYTAQAKSALLTLAASTLLASTSQFVNAEYSCHTDLGQYYPYCINVPDGASSSDKLPTIVFLSGSGARGDPSNVKSLSGYDGFGKLINQYLGGNQGADQTMAATEFVTIVPISPQNVGGQEIRHWFPEYVDKVLDDVRGKYPIDWDRLHLSGYSMGGRGCARNAVAHPDRYASMAPSAGAAEESGTGTLSQQRAPATFDKLNELSNMAVWAFAGKYDSTAGTDGTKKEEQAIQNTGNKNVKMTVLDTDHSGMSTMPFNTELMNWMLKQTRSGGSSGQSSTVTDNVAGGSSDDEDETTSSNSTSSSSSGSNSNSNANSGSVKINTGKAAAKKCSSGSSSKRHRRNKAKRDAMYAEGLRFAHAGPVRRGVYESEILGSSPSSHERRSVKAVRGLSLSTILGNQRDNGSLKKDISTAATKSKIAAVNPSSGESTQDKKVLQKFVASNNGTSAAVTPEQVQESSSKSSLNEPILKGTTSGESKGPILKGEKADSEEEKPEVKKRSQAVESLKAQATAAKKERSYVPNLKLGRRASR